ncbi:hypothetical protein Celaphus_00001674, partial [Cervus elaphus hippelaphus]
EAALGGRGGRGLLVHRLAVQLPGLAVEEGGVPEGVPRPAHVHSVAEVAQRGADHLGRSRRIGGHRWSPAEVDRGPEVKSSGGGWGSELKSGRGGSGVRGEVRWR